MLAAGRLCEMVGSKALDLDRFLRQLGLMHLAVDDERHLREPRQRQKKECDGRKSEKLLT